ncbi:uncharacterized protein LOC134211415 [Armigeres subalbatus]|uniref:uncharacterized protein LOC134211415 n=1 Tax=Armigeres subalbatus TaxID=124917 RepID=UPI002ED6105D
MSLDVSPVCSSCGKYTVLSISCTKCLQICCTACFNVLVSAMVKADVDVALLADRVCRKCNENRMNNSAINSENGTDAANVDRSEICDLHGKERTLYCLNCSTSICGDCMSLGEPHDFHRVDNLVAVYFDKASKVVDKLRSAKKLNDDLHVGSAIYRKNLEFIEKEEADMLEEIEAIAQNSRLDVSRITTARKEILHQKLKVPVTNSALLEDMWNTAKQMSPYRLLGLLPEFEANCDKLLAQNVAITVQQFDDIHCDLISPYEFTEMVFREFHNGADGDISAAHLKMYNGVEWRFTVEKTDVILIKPCTVDPQMKNVPHQLMVMFPHKNYDKTIYRTIELVEGQYNTIDLYSSFLVDEGFCDEINGDLMMKIGIRCTNVFSDLQILEHQISEYLVMHFHPKLSVFQNVDVLESKEITDDKNRQWYLRVKVVSNKFGAYICLRETSDVYCDFFIELIHRNPAKNIKRISKNQHFQTSGWGWIPFIMFDTVNNDCDFHPDGDLHFRFGVRPLVNPDASENE